MLAILAALLFLVGFIVSHAFEHPDGWLFWALLGLVALSLHEAFGGIIANKRNSSW